MPQPVGPTGQSGDALFAVTQPRGWHRLFFLLAVCMPRPLSPTGQSSNVQCTVVMCNAQWWRAMQCG
eukprot:1150834-Pelagomonas_calceolata.AAC.1